MTEKAIATAQGLVIFFTGLSGAGKSTMASGLASRLRRQVTTLDGDEMRRILATELGFSAVDRATTVRRVGWVAAEIARHGGIAICALIAPADPVRREVREMVEAVGGRFALVYVATPMDVCESRDPKGHYRNARVGTIVSFTGVSDTYDVPEGADIVLSTEFEVDETVTALSSKLIELGFLSIDDFSL